MNRRPNDLEERKILSRLARDSRLQISYGTLPLPNSGSSEDDHWERVRFSTPGLLIPYREDTITGDGNGNGLRYITINYMPEVQNRDAGLSALGYAAGPGGICNLFEATSFWIRVDCGQDPPAAGFIPRLPYYFLPYSPGIWSDPWSYANLISGRFGPQIAGQALGAATTVLFVTVQQLLQGVRGLEIATNQFGTNVRYRWINPPAGNSYLPLASTFRFQGSFLPLADLYIQNSGAGAVTIHRGFYY